MRQTEQIDEDELRPEYTAADFQGAVRGKYAGMLPAQRLSVAITCEQQENGQWRAHVAAFPLALAYGNSKDAAVDIAETMVSAAIADQVKRGEIEPTALFFVISDLAASAGSGTE
jgi:hypothetical protein